MRSDIEPIQRRGQGLVDVLDRVLDKGLVIAGDIRVSLAEVELLTIRIRLLVCSIDKAEEIGLDWWRHDPYLSGGAQAKGALPTEGATGSEPAAGSGKDARARTKKGANKRTSGKKVPKNKKKPKRGKSRKPQGGSSAR